MVTISDIARSLGVSPSTVSRALSGNSGVGESTRNAIRIQAEQLGYERNMAASSLRSGRVSIVGIIVPRINRAFFSDAISGAESVLSQAGFQTIICQTNERSDQEINALRALKSNCVAGVLISHATASLKSDHVTQNLASGTILVQFDRVFSDLSGPKVVNDNFQGAYEATRHLVEMGYEWIGHLAGVMSTEAYVQRLGGYRQALLDMGRTVDEDLIIYDSITKETGYNAGSLAIERGCDALYCAGDFAALGAINAAKDKGLAIPDDFGVVGTADEFFTELMAPTLSSVAQYPYEIGRRAAQAFLISKNKGLSIGEIVVPMKLITRESSLRNKQILTP